MSKRNRYAAVAVMLAVLVGASLAAQVAFGSTNTYCSGCSISTTARGSVLANGMTSNHISVTNARSIEIYDYINNGYGVECDDAWPLPIYSLGLACSPISSPTQAHCKLVSGTATAGTCWTDYTGGIQGRPDPGSASVGLPMQLHAPVMTAIATANRSANNGDALDPTSASLIAGDSVGTPILDSARRIGTVKSVGVFVVSTTMSRLCLVVMDQSAACADPLSDASPLNYGTFDPDGAGGTPPTTIGIAENGVQSVALTVGARHVTVPVKGNVFTYQGSSQDVASDVGSAAAVR